MKIIQITPGSGGNFYCENCLRDVWLVRALRDQGHDALIAPMYLPISTDLPLPMPRTPIFFGGINVYLQQRFPGLRQAPTWLKRLLDLPILLRWSAR